MLKKIVKAAAVTAIVGGSVLVGAGGVSADHCVSPEGDSPGFSYFGQDGRFDGGAESNAKVCRANTGSPSERAPGQSG